MELQSKIITGLERLGEVFRVLLWQKAKVYGISPIQIQILLFVANHQTSLANVSYLAKEFNVTKPTISDAVRVLLKKDFLAKDLSPADSRRYNPVGEERNGIRMGFASMNEKEMKEAMSILKKLLK